MKYFTLITAFCLVDIISGRISYKSALENLNKTLQDERREWEFERRGWDEKLQNERHEHGKTKWERDSFLNQTVVLGKDLVSFIVLFTPR